MKKRKISSGVSRFQEQGWSAMDESSALLGHESRPRLQRKSWSVKHAPGEAAFKN